MRNNRIDCLRTIAILIMLAANSTPYLLDSSSPFIFRLICSLAAPVFIFLSGYTFAMNASKNNGLKSGLYILVSAIVVDCLAWGMPPFQTFDVLYLIAFGQIVLGILKKMPLVFSYVLLAFLILIPLFFQVEYRFHISDPSWCCWDAKVSRWLFDGWFPVLPWLSFPIVGSLTFWFKFPQKSKLLYRWLLILLLVLSVFLLFNDKINQPFREGYIELFYPASIPYLMVGFLFCFLLLFIIPETNTMKQNNLLNLLTLVGRHSLFVYLFHVFLISKLFTLLHYPKHLNNFFIVMIPFYLTVYLFTYILEYFLKKNLLNNVPVWIKKPLGLY